MKAKLLAVTRILKRRFPNLSTEDTLELACELVEAVMSAKEE